MDHPRPNHYLLLVYSISALCLISLAFFLGLNAGFFNEALLDLAFSENGLAETIQNLTLLISGIAFAIFSRAVDKPHKLIFYIFSATSFFMLSREFELPLPNTQGLENTHAVLGILKDLIRVSLVLSILVMAIKLLKHIHLFKGSFKQYLLSSSAIAIYVAIVFLLAGWPFDRIEGLVANPEYFEESLETNGYLMLLLCSFVLHYDANRISTYKG